MAPKTAQQQKQQSQRDLRTHTLPLIKETLDVHEKLGSRKHGVNNLSKHMEYYHDWSDEMANRAAAGVEVVSRAVHKLENLNRDEKSLQKGLAAAHATMDVDQIAVLEKLQQALHEQKSNLLELMKEIFPVELNQMAQEIAMNLPVHAREPTPMPTDATAPSMFRPTDERDAQWLERTASKRGYDPDPFGAYSSEAIFQALRQEINDLLDYESKADDLEEQNKKLEADLESARAETVDRDTEMDIKSRAWNQEKQKLLDDIHGLENDLAESKKLRLEIQEELSTEKKSAEESAQQLEEKRKQVAELKRQLRWYEGLKEEYAGAIDAVTSGGEEGALRDRIDVLEETLQDKEQKLTKTGDELEQTRLEVEQRLAALNLANKERDTAKVDLAELQEELEHKVAAWNRERSQLMSHPETTLLKPLPEGMISSKVTDFLFPNDNRDCVTIWGEPGEVESLKNAIKQGKERILFPNIADQRDKSLAAVKTSILDFTQEYSDLPIDLDSILDPRTWPHYVNKFVQDVVSPTEDIEAFTEKVIDTQNISAELIRMVMFHVWQSMNEVLNEQSNGACPRLSLACVVRSRDFSGFRVLVAPEHSDASQHIWLCGELARATDEMQGWNVWNLGCSWTAIALPGIPAFEEDEAVVIAKSAMKRKIADYDFAEYQAGMSQSEARAWILNGALQDEINTLRASRPSLYVDTNLLNPNQHLDESLPSPQKKRATDNLNVTTGPHVSANLGGADDSGDAMSGGTASGDAASGDAASGDAASGDATSGENIHGAATSSASSGTGGGASASSSLPANVKGGGVDAPTERHPSAPDVPDHYGDGTMIWVGPPHKNKRGNLQNAKSFDALSKEALIAIQHQRNKDNPSYYRQLCINSNWETLNTCMATIHKRAGNPGFPDQNGPCNECIAKKRQCVIMIDLDTAYAKGRG